MHSHIIHNTQAACTRTSALRSSSSSSSSSSGGGASVGGTAAAAAALTAAHSPRPLLLRGDPAACSTSGRAPAAPLVPRRLRSLVRAQSATSSSSGSGAVGAPAPPEQSPPTTTAASSGHPVFGISVGGARLSLGRGSSRREVLRGVDLQVQRGSLHMLLGPNGCGKSTLLRALGGLVRLDHGTVAADGPAGFVFQNPDHQVVMPTVAADVAFGLGRYKLDEADVANAVARALDLVNLGGFAQRATHTLSGGQRQRVAIAGALAEGPAVLLLDELTTFLDAEDQFGVLRAVREVTRAAGGGVTAVWVTHRFEELDYADAASYMEAGRVVFTGSPAQMRARLRSMGAAV